MAYILVVDNHGREVARFHHSDLEHWTAQDDQIAQAVAVARAREAQFASIDTSTSEAVIEHTL